MADITPKYIEPNFLPANVSLKKEKFGFGIGDEPMSNFQETKDEQNPTKNWSDILNDDGRKPDFKTENKRLISEEIILTYEYVAGEDLTKGDVVSRVKVDQSQITTNEGKSFGQIDALNDFIGQSFKTGLTDAKIFGALMLTYKAGGTVTDNIFVTLEADNGGEPSGTPLATSQDVDGESLGGNTVYNEFRFATPVTLTAATTYWLVVQRDGALDDVNYYGIKTWEDDSTNPYTDGVALQHNTTDGWRNDSGNTHFDVCFKTLMTIDKYIYKSTAEYEIILDQTVGFAQETQTKGNAVKIQLSGTFEKADWALTELTEYYVSDTAGIIATTAGTFSRRVGKSITDGKLLIERATD